MEVVLLVLAALPVLVVGQCPAVSSISPPSGYTGTQYVITGSNLDNVASLTPSPPDANYNIVNSTHIDLDIQATGTVTITLIPTDTGACEEISDTVEVNGFRK